MTDENTRAEAQSFTHFLATLADGEAVDELALTLHKLTKSLHDESKIRNGKVKGKLSISIDFACDEQQIVRVGYAITSKLPDPRRPGSVRWATEDGRLSPSNPRQQSLPLHEVKAPSEALRELEEQGVDPVTFREAGEGEVR